MGGVIVIGASRSRPICLCMWCLYIHDHCREYHITMRFSINFPRVICLPTVCFLHERCRKGKLCPPGLFTSKFTNATIALLPLFTFYFIFSIYNYLQLSTQLICSQRTRSRGLTTLLPALGASCLLFCVHPLKKVEDWYSYWFAVYYATFFL